MGSIEGKRVVVVGGSRGLGRGVAADLAQTGARVLAVGRSIGEAPWDTRRGDATDPTFVANLMAREGPDHVVVVAGAQPALLPLSAYDWEAFSVCWHTDVKATFHWIKASLHHALPGRLVIFSSGAALNGSPLSGGYAGAKGTQRFLCQYAAGEGLHAHCVLPQLNPNTGLGAAAVEAYAARAGETPEGFVQKRFPVSLTPEVAGAAVRALLTDDGLAPGSEHVLTGGGLKRLP